MRNPNNSNVSDEAIAGALTELGEDVSVERVRQVRLKLADIGRFDDADSAAFRSAVDVARNAPDVDATWGRQRFDDAILEKYIKMSAESIASLRKDDVFRVLAGIAKENVDGVTRPELAWFIASARPDLESEVDEVMKEEFSADNWAAAAVVAPDARFESGQKVIFNSTHSEAMRDGKLNLAAEIVRPLTDEDVDLGEVGPMYVIRFENGQTEHAFEDELSSSDVVKREYLFHIEGLGRDVWQIGETEKAAYSAVWNALNDAERNRVVQIECIDERKPTASQSSETDVLAGTARRARNHAVRPHQVIPAAASTGEVLVRLPGVWDDVGDGCYVKRYQNGSDFLEASVLSDGVLRLQAKVVGGVGDVINAVQCALEKRIDLRDTTAIPTAIEALEDALARSVGVPARDSRDDQLGQPEENVRPVVARFRADGNFNEAAANLRRVIEQQSTVLRAELMGAFSGLLEAAEAVRDQYQSDWRAAKALAERVKLPSAAAPTLSNNSYLKESIRRLQNGLDCYTADAPEHAEISAALSALNGLRSGQVPIAGGLPEAAESTMRLPDSFVGDERVVRNLASFALMMARDARGDESWILAARGAIGVLRANRPDLVPEGERFAWHRDESPSPDM